MIKSGMIRQETSGIYSWLPLGYRILKKIISVIEKFHEAMLELIKFLCQQFRLQRFGKKS